MLYQKLSKSFWWIKRLNVIILLISSKAVCVWTSLISSVWHSLIRGVLIQSCCAGAKHFTNYVFCHPQFSGVIQNIENYCAILTRFVYVDYYQNNHFYRVKIDFLKFYFTGTIIFNILDNTTEFYMTNYIIGEIFSSGGATLHKNPSDETVHYIL